MNLTRGQDLESVFFSIFNERLSANFSKVLPIVIASTEHGCSEFVWTLLTFRLGMKMPKGQAQKSMKMRFVVAPPGPLMAGSRCKMGASYPGPQLSLSMGDMGECFAIFQAF